MAGGGRSFLSFDHTSAIFASYASTASACTEAACAASTLNLARAFATCFFVPRIV